VFLELKETLKQTYQAVLIETHETQQEGHIETCKETLIETLETHSIGSTY